MKEPSSKSNRSSAASLTWRTIEQKGNRKAVTDLARKRKRQVYLKTAVAFLAVILLISSLGLSVYFFQTIRAQFSISGSSEPLRLIHFETDGVLTREWFATTVPIARGTKLMDLDIHLIKEKLEGFGQIKETTVTRKFPYELHISVRERVPVLRARVSTARGSKPQERLISREGVVYEGMAYAANRLESLPYLGGVRFSTGPEGIEPVENIRELVRLLALARTRYPEIYDDWKIASLRQPGSALGVDHTLITIKSRNVKEVVFTPPAFEWQLGQLEQIIDHSRQRGIRVIKKVDLSLGDQVVVQDFPDLRRKRFRN